MSAQIETDLPRDQRRLRHEAAVAYLENGCNAQLTARTLGINPATFYRWLPARILGLIKQNDCGRILFADDQSYKQREVEDALLETGLLVDGASSGPQALAMMEERLYSCLITDQIMPGMDGIELCERALALRPGMPIILLSAYTDFDLCRLAYDEKLVSYVAKWEEFGREPAAFADRVRQLARHSDELPIPP